VRDPVPTGYVADPEPDSYVFGPLGSGPVSQMYGSGSFYHQAKIVRKSFIPTVLLLLFDFLSLKKMAIYLQKVISRKTFMSWICNTADKV
jgi:hypothetical protein